MRNHKKGFTVIELLTVLAIIGILAGLITTAAHEARKRALMAKAKAAISSVETALGMFQSDLGGYPTPGAGNANLINALSENTGTYVIGTQSYALPSDDWSGPYMNFKDEASTGEFLDPWGNPYVYEAGTDHGTGADYTGYVDIRSNGPDGISGTVDDIVNWKR
jgi:general secretion pathway protein G